MAKAATRTARTLTFVREPALDIEFTIEDDVPLPVRARATRPKRYFPFEKLSVGQSFLATKDKKAGLRAALARYYGANPAEWRTILLDRQADGAIRVFKRETAKKK